MEKWQLDEIISTGSRNEITLATRELRKTSLETKRSSGRSAFFRFLQTTLRKMTEVVALF